MDHGVSMVVEQVGNIQIHIASRIERIVIVKICALDIQIKCSSDPGSVGDRPSCDVEIAG